MTQFVYFVPQTYFLIEINDKTLIKSLETYDFDVYMTSAMDKWSARLKVSTWQGVDQEG